MRDTHESYGMVLVVGATGKLGSETTRLLLAEGYPVRALVRDPERAAQLAASGAELSVGDLKDMDSLCRACDGVEFVIASAHAALGKGANCPEAVDGRGHRDLIDAARDAGVRHFSYVSTVGISADHPVDFFRIKFKTEQYLVNSGIDYAIIAGPGFMETQHEILGGMILGKHKAFLFGRGQKKANYVSIVDMARYVVWSLQDERLRNRRTVVGGPENLTQSEVVAIYEAAGGFAVKRVAIPLPVLRLLRLVVGPFQPVVRRILTMGIVTATGDLALATEELHSEFAWQPRSYADSVRRWFDAVHRDDQGCEVGRACNESVRE